MILPLAAAAGSGLASVRAWERVTTAPMATITPQATTTNPSLMNPPGLIGTKDMRRVKLPASFALNRLLQGLMPSGGLMSPAQDLRRLGRLPPIPPWLTRGRRWLASCTGQSEGGSVPASSGGFPMSIKILEQCTNCAACEPECPNEAIARGEDVFAIDPSRCSECVGAFDSPRCVEVCPVDCIATDP